MNANMDVFNIVPIQKGHHASSKAKDEYWSYKISNQPTASYTLKADWRWNKLDYYCYKLIATKSYILIISTNTLYVCNLYKKLLVCPVNALGMITIQRNAIKGYRDLSAFDLNLGNNFTFYEHRSQKGDNLAQFLWCFDKGNFVILSIKTDEIGDIKVNLKSIMHEERHTTVPSSIGLVPAHFYNQDSEYYVIQASRYV